MQAERTDLLKKSVENLEEETKKQLSQQGKQLDEILNVLKEKRGRFFR